MDSVVRVVRDLQTNHEVGEVFVRLNDKCDAPLITSLIEAIERNESVHTANIIGPTFLVFEFPSASLASLARWLSISPTLTILDLCALRVKVEGAILISEALVQNTTLTSLDLRCNEMTSVGVIAIADAVRNHPSLCTLDLSNNDVRDDAAQSLSTLVATNSRLTRLKLSTHKMTDGATEALAAGIAANSTLTLLNLGSFEVSGAERIIEAANVNTTLVSLQLKCDAGQGMRLEEIMTRNKQFREADFVFK